MTRATTTAVQDAVKAGGPENFSLSLADFVDALPEDNSRRTIAPRGLDLVRIAVEALFRELGRTSLRCDSRLVELLDHVCEDLNVHSGGLRKVRAAIKFWLKDFRRGSPSDYYVCENGILRLTERGEDALSLYAPKIHGKAATAITAKHLLLLDARLPSHPRLNRFIAEEIELRERRQPCWGPLTTFLITGGSESFHEYFFSTIASTCGWRYFDDPNLLFSWLEAPSHPSPSDDLEMIFSNGILFARGADKLNDEQAKHLAHLLTFDNWIWLGRRVELATTIIVFQTTAAQSLIYDRHRALSGSSIEEHLRAARQTVIDEGLVATPLVHAVRHVIPLIGKAPSEGLAPAVMAVFAQYGIPVDSISLGAEKTIRTMIPSGLLSQPTDLELKRELELLFRPLLLGHDHEYFVLFQKTIQAREERYQAGDPDAALLDRG